MIAIYYDSKLDGFEFKVLNYTFTLTSTSILHTLYTYKVFTLGYISKSLHFTTFILKKEKEQNNIYNM